MPLAFLIIGIILAISAFRNTYGDLGKLLIGDFTGSPNFLIWVGAIVVVGSIGFVPKLQTPTRLFLALILVAMFLSNGGVFQKLASALSGAQPGAPSPSSQEPQFASAAPVKVSGLGGGSGGSGIGGIASAASAIGSFL